MPTEPNPSRMNDLHINTNEEQQQRKRTVSDGKKIPQTV